MGIALQVISPMPELFSYWLPAAAANDLLRYTNDQIAEFVAASNSRLLALAGIPLQDLDLAILELTRACTQLGCVGVEIGSNVNGLPIGAPHFDPFFAAAEKLNAAIFVHAVRPAGMDRLVGPNALQQVLAYPTDVGLAAASVITANTLLRFPKLRIAFSHGGGTLAALLPRLAEGVRVFPALRDSLQQDVYQQARRFFYDTLVYDEVTLRHLLAVFGDTQLLIGTDYPFNFHERRPLQRIDDAVPDEAVRTKLRHANAARFLHLEATA
jgi:aminocarboxymuconate-semialdehyde decarboxylase